MDSPLSARRILLAVTGSIAAYKSCDLIRLLAGAGAQVQAMVSESGERFVGRATLQALSGRPVLSGMFAGAGAADGMDHIASVRQADAMVIAPASANVIARLAAGLADDLVAAAAVAADCPIVIAPAMNRQMWESPAVQRNVRQLAEDGVVIVGPDCGWQACGEIGRGRMAEPELIAARIGRLLAADLPLAGRTVVVSAGATATVLDEMRVISNLSTGRMGCAVAAAAAAAGARVVLLAARLQVQVPDAIDEVRTVVTNDELMAASLAVAGSADAYIGVAAVADWQPAAAATGKPARQRSLSLQLEPTEDIIAAVAGLADAPLCIAFAAESGSDAIAGARRKMRAKGVDAIVAAPVAANLGGEGCDLTLLGRGLRRDFGPMDKRQAAAILIEHVGQMLPKSASGLRRA